MTHICDTITDVDPEVTRCGKPLWLASANGGGYCREHADEAYGAACLTPEDAARYLDLRAAEIPPCTAETCAGQNCESCRWRHAAHEHREWMKTRAG